MKHTETSQTELKRQQRTRVTEMWGFTARAETGDCQHPDCQHHDCQHFRGREALQAA